MENIQSFLKKQERLILLRKKLIFLSILFGIDMNGLVDLNIKI